MPANPERKASQSFSDDDNSWKSVALCGIPTHANSVSTRRVGQNVSFWVQLSLVCLVTSQQRWYYPTYHHCYQYRHCGNLQLYNQINILSSVFCATFRGCCKIMPGTSHDIKHTRASFYSRSGNSPGAAKSSQLSCWSLIKYYTESGGRFRLCCSAASRCESSEEDWEAMLP